MSVLCEYFLELGQHRPAAAARQGRTPGDTHLGVKIGVHRVCVAQDNVINVCSGYMCAADKFVQRVTGHVCTESTCVHWVFVCSGYVCTESTCVHQVCVCIRYVCASGLSVQHVRMCNR